MRSERQWERRYKNLGAGRKPQMSVLHRWRISQFLIKILYVVGCKPDLAFWNTGVRYTFRVWLTPDRYRSTLILLLSAAVANGRQSCPARQFKLLLIDGNQPNPISCLSAILSCLFMANLGTGWAAGCCNCWETDGVESVAVIFPSNLGERSVFKPLKGELCKWQSPLISQRAILNSQRGFTDPSLQWNFRDVFRKREIHNRGVFQKGYSSG